MRSGIVLAQFCRPTVDAVAAGDQRGQRPAREILAGDAVAGDQQRGRGQRARSSPSTRWPATSSAATSQRAQVLAVDAVAGDQGGRGPHCRCRGQRAAVGLMFKR